MLLSERVKNIGDQWQSSPCNYVRLTLARSDALRDVTVAFIILVVRVVTVPITIGGWDRRCTCTSLYEGLQLLKLSLAGSQKDVLEVTSELARMCVASYAAPFSLRHDDRADERLPFASASTPLASHRWRNDQQGMSGFVKVDKRLDLYCIRQEPKGRTMLTILPCFC